MDTKQILLDLPWHISLMLALIAAIRYWPLYKDSTQRLFLYFLIYVVLNETVGLVFRILESPSAFIYNIYMIISFSFYLYWFGLILKKKKMAHLFLLLFLITVLFSLNYESFWESLLLLPFTVGTVFVLFCVASYFLDLLEKTYTINLQRSQKFWIITGLLIFNIGFLPLVFFQSELNTFGIAYSLIITLLNVILYVSYIIGFLCLRKN